MAPIPNWKAGFHKLVLGSSEMGMCESDECIFCLEPMEGTGVYWTTGREDGLVLVFHSRCALDMARHLAVDAYCAETSLKIPRSKDPALDLECIASNWRQRLFAEQRKSRS